MCCERRQILAGWGQLPGLAGKRRCYLSSAGSRVSLRQCCVGKELLMHYVWTSEQEGDGGKRTNEKKERGGKEVERVGSPPSSPRLWHFSLLRVDPLLPKASQNSLPSSALFHGTFGPAEGCPGPLAAK